MNVDVVPPVRKVRPADEDFLPERSVPLMSRLKTLWRLLSLPCEEMFAGVRVARPRPRAPRVGRAAVAPAVLRRLPPLPAADQPSAVQHAAIAKARRRGRAIARYRSPGRSA